MSLGNGVDMWRCVYVGLGNLCYPAAVLLLLTAAN